MSEDEYRAANPSKLRLYDIRIDGWRDATQADLDAYGAASRAYGRIREESRKAHEELMAAVNG